MFGTEWIIVTISIVWAVGLLITQWLLSRGPGRTDFSKGVGQPWDGIIYNFTHAMMPAHKESVRLHPDKFTIGILMHIGTFIALIKMLVVLVVPDIAPLSPLVLSIILGVSILCGLYLLIRRITTPALRAMSSPDDYISVILTTGLMITAIAHETLQMSSGAFLVCVSVVLFYLPLGKLRHALFFFVARTDYGSRLGYRGTYPATKGAGD